MHFKLRLIPAATAAVLLVACGGGGNPSSTAVTYTPTSGIALDGYLQFAKVVCDTNENGVADASEPTVYTLGSATDSGKFTFPQGCATHSMIASGGTNADTGLMFNGVMRAPAGATVISPFTTMMASGMTLAQLTAALGPVGADPLHTDPLAQTDLTAYKKALAVQQLLQKTTELLAGLGGVVGSAAIQPIYTEVTAALVAALQSGASPAPLLSTGASPVMDVAVVNAAVLQAIQRVAVAPSVSAAVKTTLAGINSVALANVVAPGMQVQAQALLASSNAGLVAATTAAQTSTYITDYVKYVKSQLAGTPAPSAVTALGATLATDVATGNNSIVVVSAGTVLVSFDEVTPAFTGMGAYGGALPNTPAAPSGGNGNALKIEKPAGAEAWGGVYFGVTPLPFTADRKKISARVYSTRADAVIKFKVEIAGGANVEIASSPTGPANTWSTVTWDFSAVDITKSYTTIAITPDQTVVTSGQSYYIDEITLLAAATPPTTGDYLSVANDAISLTDRGVITSLPLTTFQTSPGVSVKWPLSSPATLNVTLAQVGNFTLASTQTLKAAVQITETGIGQGKVMAYIDNVSVSKTDSNITISIPTSGSAAKVYGVSTDGAKKAVIDFSNSVKNVTNTLSLTGANSILFGDMVNYAINNVSNDFTGITGLRGTYKVTVVVSDLPLKKADGSAFAPFTINVPTALDAGGAATSTMPVTGLGLEGYITLID
jgi:hypothetical protein